MKVGAQLMSANDTNVAITIVRDITIMPKDFDDFKYLLVATCETTYFVLVVPIKTRAGSVTADNFIHRFINILAFLNY